QASDSLGLHHRKDICTMGATRAATERALKMASLTVNDVDVAEVHDNFTISEVLAVEDIGFFAKGEGGKATEEGRTSLDGDVAVNTSGGLKARGDPIGATGVAQAVEVVNQLRGTADKRQVKDATVGLTQNVGGTGATVVVHLFRRV
ncbi:TPA: thiolase domain-containing protein, partial [Thermoplasmata archaeon]|nr:thiolase domain-containing protein [Thermoplasmata archaeon]